MTFFKYFGLNDHMMYSFLILIGIGSCYFIVKPIIVFVVTYKSKVLLNYLLGCLLFISLLFGIAIFNEQLYRFVNSHIKFILQSLALLGGMLLIVRLFKLFVSKISS